MKITKFNENKLFLRDGFSVSWEDRKLIRHLHADAIYWRRRAERRVKELEKLLEERNIEHKQRINEMYSRLNGDY